MKLAVLCHLAGNVEKMRKNELLMLPATSRFNAPLITEHVGRLESEMLTPSEWVIVIVPTMNTDRTFLRV